MKKLIYILMLVCPVMVNAQIVPTDAFQKVRLTQGDRMLLAEIKPVSSNPKAKPGLWYSWYSASQINTTQGGFSGKLLNGEYKEWYLNKNLKEQGQFDRGLKSGIWKTWREDGTLSATYTWKNGQHNGPFAVYNEKGLPQTQGSYHNDLLDGKIKNYVNADSAEVTRYKDGKVVLPKRDSSSFLRRINIFKHKKGKKDSTSVKKQ
ncbi:hypothetical protein LJ707_10425 [Mucilaginibacter sp. UR6-1]|uniref:toxin-antitoxin system YwqK family antitoxin n=1 Tax=Mucilaginibacter sp. UR6-1 TaxID=1435643 RepID=UPI001E47A387|nr:hypothetical protein [Mucilaginibacter sp. UR6-1]MCC8409348.1 hypothetical protein [Mucilaginibacter sp. UR6-1]